MKNDTEQLNRRINTSKRASIIVDAAVALPIFLLSMCLILSLILNAGKEDNGVLKMLKLSLASSKAIAVSGMDVVDELVLTDSGHILLYRPFIGEKHGTDSEWVYIFPKRGERYHVDGCSTMKNGDIVSILTDEIRRRYSACKICKPDALPNGATVCIFSDTSSVYHRQSCASITKSYECVRKSEAIERGYTACMLCLGHLNQNFED